MIQKFQLRPNPIDAMQFSGDLEAIRTLCPGADRDTDGAVWIPLRAGWQRVSPGDWVTKGADGLFLVYSDRNFKAMYEVAP